MNRSAFLVFTCGVALWSAGHVHASIRVPAARPTAARDTPSPKPPPEVPGAVSPVLRIGHVRLEPPAEESLQPSMVLKFDVLNEGLSSVTDVVIEIAIREKTLVDGDANRSRPIVGPFTISGQATIHAGYTVAYEMLLRNLTPACQCTPDVRVISARSLPGAGL